MPALPHAAAKSIHNDSQPWYSVYRRRRSSSLMSPLVFLVYTGVRYSARFMPLIGLPRPHVLVPLLRRAWFRHMMRHYEGSLMIAYEW
eukprot:2121510-Rhodomonas_salina.2